MLVPFNFWRLLCFLKLPSLELLILVTSLLVPIVRMHLVNKNFSCVSLVVCVFARWHQELGHDSSELVSLVFHRVRPGTVRCQVVIVRAKGHGGFTSQWLLMCRPEWWWAVN